MIYSPVDSKTAMNKANVNKSIIKNAYFNLEIPKIRPRVSWLAVSLYQRKFS